LEAILSTSSAAEEHTELKRVMGPGLLLLFISGTFWAPACTP
jgi:hypothetical protein